MRLAVLPGLGDARLDTIPKDVPLILGEHRQHPRHRLTARHTEIQRIIQRHEITPFGCRMMLLSFLPTHHLPCPPWRTELLSAERIGVKVEPSEKRLHVLME
jgi:hypothetical protein